MTFLGPSSGQKQQNIKKQKLLTKWTSTAPIWLKNCVSCTVFVTRNPIMTFQGPDSGQKRQKNSKTKFESKFQKIEKSKNLNQKHTKYKPEVLVKMTNKEFPESH